MSTDFKIEFNDNGTWQVALVDVEHDANNVSLWYIDGSDGTWHDKVASRGVEAGQFRDRA